MPRQFWNEAVVWATSSGVAVANLSAETILFPDVTIFANYMQDGRCLRYRAIGQYSTTGTPTMIFGLRWNTLLAAPSGGVLLCKTAACTTPSGIATGLWDLDVLIQTRTNGSVGAIMANGILRLCAAAAGTVASATGEALVTPITLGGATGAPGAATCDLTTDKALQLTLTWSAPSVSNTATGLNQIVEALN